MQHFSIGLTHLVKLINFYNEKLKEEEKKFNIVTGIQQILKIWKMKRLTLKLNSVQIRENTDQKKTPYLDTFHAVVFYKKVLLEILQNSQENVCFEVSFKISCRVKA